MTSSFSMSVILACSPQVATVTLNEVAETIRRGRRVTVVNAKTNEDVRAFTLHQIILEEARTKNYLLPVSFLQLIIQHRGDALTEFFEKYLQITLENYMAYKASFDEQFKKWLGLSMNLSDLTWTSYQPFFDLGKKKATEKKEGDNKSKADHNED